MGYVRAGAYVRCAGGGRTSGMQPASASAATLEITALRNMLLAELCAVKRGGRSGWYAEKLLGRELLRVQCKPSACTERMKQEEADTRHRMMMVRWGAGCVD